VCWRQIERLQQSGEVVPVLIDAAWIIRPLAAGVAPPVIAEHIGELGQAGTTSPHDVVSTQDP
jgi:hypothetical protein